MAEHAIGSRISLVSKAEIRYEGYLHFINPEENTVGLKDVRMLGTQGRRGGQGEVEPNTTVYDFIIFRGGDIKDLTVFDDEPQPKINDPAIMSSGAKASQQGGTYADRARAIPQQNNTQDRREDRRDNFGTARQGNQGGGFYDARREDRRDDRRDDRFTREDRFTNNNHREDRFNNNNTRGGFGGGRGSSRIDNYEGGRGGRAGGYSNNHDHRRDYHDHRRDYHDTRRDYNNYPRQEYHTGRDFEVAEKKEKLEDFDFVKASAEFEKHKAEFQKAKEEVQKANEGRASYDKSSFFDNISSEAKDRRVGGNMYGRLAPEEQRRADVQTFGQEAVGNMRGFRRGRGGRGRFGRN